MSPAGAPDEAPTRVEGLIRMAAGGPCLLAEALDEGGVRTCCGITEHALALHDKEAPVMRVTGITTLLEVLLAKRTVPDERATGGVEAMAGRVITDWEAHGFGTDHDGAPTL